MDSLELRKKLNEATAAIKAYTVEGEQRIGTKRSFSETADKMLLKLATDKLVKEAFQLLPAGQPCPKCGGSGRI